MEEGLGGEDLGCDAGFCVDDAAAAKGCVVGGVGVEGGDGVDVGCEEDGGAAVGGGVG